MGKHANSSTMVQQLSETVRALSKANKFQGSLERESKDSLERQINDSLGSISRIAWNGKSKAAWKGSPMKSATGNERQPFDQLMRSSG